MLLNTKELYGYKLAASDGSIGHVKDFYFDDKTWVVRYVVADTETWLGGRQVLLPPDAFGRFDHEEKLLPVNLTRQQIENCPLLEPDQPPGRQDEADCDNECTRPIPGYRTQPMDSPWSTATDARTQDDDQTQSQLRSAHEVTDYDLQAIDGTIGHLRGLMVNDENWSIRILIVEAGSWYAGREILISSRKVGRISAEESKVFMDVALMEIPLPAGNRPHAPVAQFQRSNSA